MKFSMYEFISNDKDLLEIYNQIDSLECSRNLWAHHGLSHIRNVVNIVENVLVQLDCDKELMDVTMATAFLHDLGCLYGKKDHAKNGYEIVKKYFADKNINSKYNNDILMSIKYHSNFRYLKTPIVTILRFADKLDTTKERLAYLGYNIKGIRQYQYIEKIDVKINDKLIINFLTDSRINKQEIEKFYFIKKIFRAIDEFANYIEKPYVVLFNNKTWHLK